MSFKSLPARGRRRIARAALGLLVLAVAAIAQYKLAKVPRPVNLETLDNFSTVKVRLGREELIIEGPVVNSSEMILFSYSGKPNELVDTSFDQARLGEQTLKVFESLGLRPPSTPARIDYRAQEPKSSPTGDESCSTQVELRAVSKMPDELHLFQLDAPDLNYRQLMMKAVGAELNSRMLVASPSGSYSERGCQKLLKVGEWTQSISNIVTAIVADNSDLRLSFKPLTADSALGADTGGFVILDLGAPQLNKTGPLPFQARAVYLRPLGSSNNVSDSHALLSARHTDDGPLLTISNLRIGPDQLQLTVTGKGWVTINGDDYTVNFLKRAEDNPILIALMAAANTALLAWVARLILKSPPTSPQPKHPQSRSRKLQRQRKGKTKK
jgi:hypothetical protein